MHDVVVLDHASASSLNLLPGQPFHRCEVGINASIPLYLKFYTYQVTTGLSAVILLCTVFDRILQARGRDHCFESRGKFAPDFKHFITTRGQRAFDRNDVVDFSSVFAALCLLN